MSTTHPITHPIVIIGLGMEPGQLLPQARTEARAAQVLMGGRRQLTAFAEHPGEKLAIAGPLGEVLARVREPWARGLKVAVLADGDPLFFGIGERMLAEFGAANVRVLPNVTALQTACARVGMPWAGVVTVSLHGRSDAAPLFAAVTHHERVGVYTDVVNSPAAVAGLLLERGAEDFEVLVFEDLGLNTERWGRYGLREAAGRGFSGLSFVLVERVRPAAVRLRLGMADDDFVKEKGLITKRAVRAVGLAALELPGDGVLWDLGAGCGSVAIEAAALMRRGRVLAVEREAARAAMIAENLRRSGAFSVQVVRGDMPGCLEGLPAPDRVFIGGGLGGGPSGAEVLETACAALAPGGILVAHCVLLGSLERARRVLERLGWELDVQQVQVSRGVPLAGDLRLAAENPVFVVRGVKPEVA